MSENKEEFCQNWDKTMSDFGFFIGKTKEEVEAILSAPPFEIKSDDVFALNMLQDEEIVPFGDLRSVFCEKHGVPLPKLRMAMKAIRQKNNKNEIDPAVFALQEKFGIKASIEDLGVSELIPLYSPLKHNIIFERLQVLEKRYGPFIVFKKASHDIHTDAILNYIADLDSGFERAKVLEHDGEYYKIHSVGELPNEELDEDPLYPGYALRNGRSTQNRIKWADIDLVKKQFLRHLLVARKINPSNRLEINALIKMKLSEIYDMFPEECVDFENSKKPDLKVMKIQDLKNKQSLKQNPFYIN